jgi:hypothetical protein
MHDPDKNPPIDQLPDELLFWVFQQAIGSDDTKTYAGITRVCTKWYEMAHDQSLLYSLEAGLIRKSLGLKAQNLEQQLLESYPSLQNFRNKLNEALQIIQQRPLEQQNMFLSHVIKLFNDFHHAPNPNIWQPIAATPYNQDADFITAFHLLGIAFRLLWELKFARHDKIVDLAVAYIHNFLIDQLFQKNRRHFNRKHNELQFSHFILDPLLEIEKIIIKDRIKNTTLDRITKGALQLSVAAIALTLVLSNTKNQNAFQAIILLGVTSMFFIMIKTAYDAYQMYTKPIAHYEKQRKTIRHTHMFFSNRRLGQTNEQTQLTVMPTRKKRLYKNR